MRIRVPATSANLGPGFDTLGMALKFYNHFEAHPADALQVELSSSTCVETNGMSLDPTENLLAQAYSEYFRFRGKPIIPAKLVIEAHIPLSRGMGSSSSTIVGGLFLADLMHPNPLGKSVLLPWAIQLEGHPDNVTPALLGGVHCSLSNGRSIRLTWPEDWKILLVIPPTPLSTHEARALVPAHYTRDEVIENLRGISAWMHAVNTLDPDLMKYALKADRIHEPARGQLIPEYPILRGVLKQTDAIGAVISGSGSTLAVFTSGSDIHDHVQTLLKAPKSGLSHCRILTVTPDEAGAHLQTQKSSIQI